MWSKINHFHPGLLSAFWARNSPGEGWVRAIESLTPGVASSLGPPEKALWQVWGAALPGAVHLWLITIPQRNHPGEKEVSQETRLAPPGPASPGTLAHSPALAAGLPDGSGWLLLGQFSKWGPWSEPFPSFC